MQYTIYESKHCYFVYPDGKPEEVVAFTGTNAFCEWAMDKGDDDIFLFMEVEWGFS